MKRFLFPVVFFLTYGAFAGPPEAQVFGKAYVQRPSYLWSEPGSFGSARAKLSPGAAVEVIKGNTNTQWVKVRLPDGQEGFLLKSMLGDSRPKPAPEKPRAVASSKPRNPASPDEPPPLSEDVPLAPESGAAAETSAEAAVESYQESQTQNAEPATGDVYKVATPEQNASEEQAPTQSQTQAATVGEAPTEKSTQQDPLMSDVDSIYAQEVRKDRKTQKKREQAQNQSSQKTKKAPKDEDFSEQETPYFAGVSLEWADQFSHDHTFGWGVGAFGLYSLRPEFSLGLAVHWNRYNESVKDTALSIEIKRTAKRWLIGPMMRYKVQNFRLDAVFGWDRTQTKFTARDTATGEDLVAVAGSSFVGSYSESALGLNLRAAYALELKDQMALEFFAGYGIGFHGGESAASGDKGSTPQYFFLGSAFGVGF